MSGKKGFKIPKPPGRGSCSSFAMYTKAKYREINDGTASEPELQGAAALDFSGRATILGNLWKALSDEAKKPFEAMGQREYERKLREYEDGAEARDDERRRHCRKLGLPLDTSWERIKRAYDGAAGGSGGSNSPTPSSSASSSSSSSSSSVEELRRKRMEKEMALAKDVKGGGGGGRGGSSGQGEGKRRRTQANALEDPAWATAWEAVLRRKAIMTGLDQVGGWVGGWVGGRVGGWVRRAGRE